MAITEIIPQTSLPLIKQLASWNQSLDVLQANSYDQIEFLKRREEDLCNEINRLNGIVESQRGAVNKLSQTKALLLEDYQQGPSLNNASLPREKPRSDTVNMNLTNNSPDNAPETIVTKNGSENNRLQLQQRIFYGLLIAMLDAAGFFAWNFFQRAH